MKSRKEPPSRWGRVSIASAVAIGVAVALVAPTAANASTVISQANGQLVNVSLLNSNLLNSLVALQGAQATNSTGTQNVVANTPLDLSAANGLIGLKSQGINLFGPNGIIQLGALGQYAAANNDGSSSAFSGVVSAAPSLLGVGTVVAGTSVGTPNAGRNAQINLVGGSPSTSTLSLGISLGGLAASASMPAPTSSAPNPTATGKYNLATSDIVVGGTVLNPLFTGIGAAVGNLVSQVNAVAPNAGLVNPFSGGTLTLSLQNLLSAAGVSNLNALPAGADLLSYVPQAVLTQVTGLVNGIVAAVQSIINNIPLLGPVVNGILTPILGVLNGLLSGLNSVLSAPLAGLISAVGQLKVNVQNTANGVFTETALQLGLGPNGSVLKVNLANASVGPNASFSELPILAGGTAGLLVGAAVLAFGTVTAAVALDRRRRQSALRQKAF